MSPTKFFFRSNNLHFILVDKKNLYVTFLQFSLIIRKDRVQVKQVLEKIKIILRTTCYFMTLSGMMIFNQNNYVLRYGTVLYCTVLYCSVLYCTVLYFTVLYCTVLYCTVLYSSFPMPLS